MEAIGCASMAAICACGLVRNRRGRPQVLPAYGLQDLWSKPRSPKTKSNPNTMCLPSTLGEDLGSGHFYLAKTRTFLLCVDRGRVLIVKNARSAREELRAHGDQRGETDQDVAGLGGFEGGEKGGSEQEIQKNQR